MVTLKNKEDIYDLLKLGFKEEEKISLAGLAAYLNSKKFSYQEYGYKKLKSLLKDLSFLTFEADEKNRKDAYVVLHPFSCEKETKKDDVKPILTEKEKKRIESLLNANFISGKGYSLSEVSAFCQKEKIDYKKYGYTKMKKFLEDFQDLLSMKNDPNDHSKIIVTFLSKKKEEKMPKMETKKANTCLPEPKKDCFFVPNALLLSIKEFSSVPCENDSILKTLLMDYKKAYQQQDFREKDDAFIFPISYKTKEGEKTIASIKKAAKNSPYRFYLNFVGTDKEKAGDVFLDKIHFEDIEKSMEDLASIARKEKWCYHNSKDKHIILKIYLQYTFYQIYSQKKIAVDEKTGYCCFNTGLKSPEYEDIYAVLRKNKSKEIRQDYLFEGFSLSGSQGLGKIIVEHFNPLPQKATFIKSNDDLIFNTSADIHTDIHHILIDNLDRFPISFLENMTLPFAEERKILLKIEKERNPFVKDKLFSKLENMIEKNEVLFSLLRVSLTSSIQKAIRMVQYDYRNALPSFFPTRNVMSMMLPLKFTNQDEVQAVLLIEKTPSGNYQGQTILTLKQCYVNARLISPLENTFLNPGKIED